MRARNPTNDVRSALSLAVPAAPPPELLAALEPFTPGELRAAFHGGENDSAAIEPLLAWLARIEGALDLTIGDHLAALTEGSRLISLGFSCLEDYARDVVDVKERRAQAMARLSRELRRRPLLRRAVMAGEVRIRNTETVLPVAIGDAEAGWVERARTETVRALEGAVKQAQAAGEPDGEWTRLRVRLSPEERTVVDDALWVAGQLDPGSTRAQRLEAMAQEYVGEHPIEAGDDGAGITGAFRRVDPERRARAEARLEEETLRWAFLEPVPTVAALDVDCAGLSALEIDARLKELARLRSEWDRAFGWCALAVRRSGLWRTAGFVAFEHYCKERLGLSPRTVEQRAALEKRIWESPALGAARDGGVSYERLRLLAWLPEREIVGWVHRAAALTCVELRAALDDRDEAQMRAARVLRARVPERIALLLQSAFRAARATEGRMLDDGRCLVVVARHFLETWRAHAKPRRTASQRVRDRDLHRCQVPGCSRRAVHAHHVVPRSRGGSDDPSNLVALCACHHLRGIHGGFLRVRGTAPGALAWELALTSAPFRAGARPPVGEACSAEA